MIREFAFSYSDRHHFYDSSKKSSFENTAKDTFISLYGYDSYAIKFFNGTKSLSGFDGKIYMPKEFLLDVDGGTVENAKAKTIELLKLLKSLEVPYNIYFSGRGFHVGIPDTSFKWEPCQNLHLKVKDELTKKGIYNYADPSVTDKTRIIRLNNTLNTKSRLWKIYLDENELNNLSGLEIQALASKSRQDKLPQDLVAVNPVFDVLVRNTKKETVMYKTEVGMNPDPVNHPCISSMLQGTSFGNRHAVALRIAAWLRWRYPEHTVRLIMEDWRKRVSSDDHPFNESEMSRLVTDCYKGHGGSGYRYGCMDTVMDSFCKSTCKIYKAKKSTSLMSAEQMENALVNFYRSDLKPINVGEHYGLDFPIYPGELVVVQAPPKSMKTMLIQNWVNNLKKPTYFLEMEMSARQIWQRFIQIEKGWTEDEIRQYYATNMQGISDSFKWLYVDYAPCMALELEKKINMLPIKPEVVVIDHMGLMQSKHKDLNLKMEEIAQALTEVAIRNNIVVFAICEITKTAMTEGMNIASVRGSFRIAYNASKILSISARKGPGGNITHLIVDTTANREKEQFNVTLKVDNLKMTT
tara:strand:- start:4391 stop:6130 length:1740 start_codon:yes stop_codon:yes gene_type:complete